MNQHQLQLSKRKPRNEEPVHKTVTSDPNPPVKGNVKSPVETTKINKQSNQMKVSTASTAPPPLLLLSERKTGKFVNPVVYTDDIVEEAITWEKIANRSVDESKIKPLSIGTKALKDFAIEHSKLAPEV